MSQILREALEEYISDLYPFVHYEPTYYIRELEILEGREISLDEDISPIEEKHMEKLYRNVIDDIYPDDIVYFITCYSAVPCRIVLSKFPKKDYINLIRRNYIPSIMCSLIRGILHNITSKDEDIIMEIIDRAPFVWNPGLADSYYFLLKKDSLSEKVILKLRETIIKNLGVKWSKNESISVDSEALEEGAKDLVNKFNEYIVKGAYEVEKISPYEFISQRRNFSPSKNIPEVSILVDELDIEGMKSSDKKTRFMNQTNLF